MRASGEMSNLISCQLRRAAVLALPILVASCAQLGARPGEEQAVYDVVILNGRVVDPASGLDGLRNIGISGGTVAVVSEAGLRGRDTIDAAGLVVAPGFIDTDTYMENARLQLLDGVTTALSLLVGTAEVDRWYAQHEGRLPINYGVAIDYSQARAKAQAEGTYQPNPSAPWEVDLTPVLSQVERGLAEGAVALSLGLDATLQLSGAEVFQAFRTSAGAGAHVVATLPGEDWYSGDATGNLARVIGAAAATGAVIHIPHILSTGGPRLPEMLRLIAAARERGIEVTAEDYPFRAAMGSLSPGEADDWPDHELHDVQPVGYGARLTRETYAGFRDRNVLVWFHNDSVEPFLAEAIASPLVSIASHSSPPSLTSRGFGHPRTAGTYSRLLGTYVREQELLPLAEAIRKASLMPAQRLAGRVPEMARKGRLQAGADADIVLFDPSAIAEQASLDDLRPSHGVRFVLVNGSIVVRDGAVQEDVMAGRPVRAPIN
jgi:cytosine/adenosine deaminase-related metal-dependent hydrolase